jgi:probable F420-dependent oxidoreductase
VGGVQLSVGLPNFGAWLGSTDWRRFLDLGRMADDAGVDRIVVVDHVVMGPHTEAYRWGRFPTPPDAPWLEPLTVLAALSSVTTRVRLATGIIIASLRGGAVLAKTAATIDVLSAGRLDLGVGLGWQVEEYRAAGRDWAQRGDLLSDTLAVCAALWTDSPAAVELPTIAFHDVWCEPKPVQLGGVPIWVAGTLAPRNLERVVRWAQGWIPIMGEKVEGLAAGVRTLHAALAAAGREPTSLRVQGALPIVRDADGQADLAASMAGAPELVAAGATAVHVPLQAFARSGDAAEPVLRELVAKFAAALA